MKQTEATLRQIFAHEDTPVRLLTAFLACQDKNPERFLQALDKLNIQISVKHKPAPENGSIREAWATALDQKPHLEGNAHIRAMGFIEMLHDNNYQDASLSPKRRP